MSDITRRDAVKVIAVTGAAASTGCLQVSGSAVAAQSNSEVMVNPILSVRPLPKSGPWPTLDPFLFCVHHDDRYPAGNAKLGPDASLAGRRLGQDFGGRDGWNMYHGQVVPGFPRHPHRGFETVTVVRHGLVDHSDSMGAAARYGDGDVQWLTAGDGINHAEMFPLLRRDQPNPIDFFQIWLNLPAVDKRVKPYFSMFWQTQVPQMVTKDVHGRSTQVTVIAGTYGDSKTPKPPPNSWAAKAQSNVAIWTVKLEAQAQWILPKTRVGTQRSVYVVTGKGLTLAGHQIGDRQQVVLRPEYDVATQAGTEPVELLLLQGRPIGEPVVQHGPFVMNTRDEIQQAYQDYRRTQFGGWPWPGADPVHGREPGRFAKHADGRVERPT